MSDFNQLQAPRIAERLRRMLGEEIQVASVSPELLLVHVLENDRPEGWSQQREFLNGGTFDVVSAAGTRNQVMLYNPSTVQNPVVGTVRRVRYTLTAAGLILWKIYRGGFPAGFAQSFEGPIDSRDPRVIVAVNGALLQTLQLAQAGAIAGSAFDQLLTPANTIVEDNEPVIIGPQSGLLLEAGLVGVNEIQGGFRWIERSIRPEEGVVA